MKVVFRKAALNSIHSIADYIVNEIGMPETAERFISDMQRFAIKLGDAPKSYPICRNIFLNALNLRCAVFKKKWIFAYKISGKNILIYDIIYGPLLK